MVPFYFSHSLFILMLAIMGWLQKGPRKFSPQCCQHETEDLNSCSCSEWQYRGTALSPDFHGTARNEGCMQWAKPNPVGTDRLEKEIPITKRQKCCSNRKMRILCSVFLREAKMFCIQGLLGDKTIHSIKNITFFSLILI